MDSIILMLQRGYLDFLQLSLIVEGDLNKKGKEDRRNLVSEEANTNLDKLYGIYSIDDCC